jgi:hypothetical protein
MFLGLADLGPSFYHQAKLVRKTEKTLKSLVLLLLYDFSSLKNDVNVASKRNKQKIIEKNNF